MSSDTSQIAFIMYPVSDLTRAVAFYRDGLGLFPSGLKTDAWVEFDIGGTTFGVGNFEQIGKPGSGQSLALEVDDLAGMRKSLGENGIVCSEPYAMESCSIAIVKDPDGNQIWLHQMSPDRKG